MKRFLTTIFTMALAALYTAGAQTVDTLPAEEWLIEPRCDFVMPLGGGYAAVAVWIEFMPVSHTFAYGYADREGRQGGPTAHAAQIWRGEPLFGGARLRV